MFPGQKKILVISYYWPPAGGPGVQRWLKFVKYLPDFGWTPTVFIPENPSYPILDETLIGEISPETEIISSKIWEPYQVAEWFGKKNKKYKAGQFDVGENQDWKSKLSIWIRGNFFIPDARVFWVKPSVAKLTPLLKEEKYDAVVTTGPPHSVHLIGLALKRKFPEINWIADFRDPWTEISYYKHLKLTAAADKKHRSLEKEVLKAADITLATSYTDAANFSASGANAFCITNGFDGAGRQGEKKRNGKFTLAYIGVLEQLRNPEILWEVLNEIISEDERFRNFFELRFVGRLDDQILDRIEESDLGKMTTFLGYVPHAEANLEMEKADLLLLTNFPDGQSKGIIPGKIFEYLASGSRLISFGPAGSDVQKILDETKAGRHFTYADRDSLKAFLQEQFENWQQGQDVFKPENIERFSRRNLTKYLANLLDRATTR